jgi:peptidyl-prolyl cis-trans isomerase SurA
MMTINSINRRNLNTKTALIVLFIVFAFTVDAQEIIKEKPTDSIKVKLPQSRQKVDGIIATVGDYMVLDSDIDKAYLEISSQGNSIKDITRCQMLGKLLEDKLYSHQAIQDSIVVRDDEVKKMMEDRINYMVEQIGSMDKVIQYYKKNTEEEFKTYFFDILKENKLSEDMQKKIIDAVEVTPEEVRTFFKKIPFTEAEPLISAEPV